MDEPEDKLPALIAEIDQAIANADHVARWGRGLYEAFIAEGFTEAQALRLTIAQMMPGE